MDKDTLTTIIVSNIVSLRKQGRADEIEGYFQTLNKSYGVSREDFNAYVGLAIKNLERLGEL